MKIAFKSKGAKKTFSDAQIKDNHYKKCKRNYVKQKKMILPDGNLDLHKRMKCIGNDK